MSRRIFISHSGADSATADRVAAHLRRAGLDPLLDREKLRAGDSFLEFMERALSTSDYVLLLWSRQAAQSNWVQLEWEAALHKAVAEARAFLMLGRLDPHPVPALLSPRLFVDLYPNLLPGIEELVRLWVDDEVTEHKSGKPVASNPLLASVAEGVPVYITSELFGVTVPIAVDLSAPAGTVMLTVKDKLSLPNSLDHHAQIGVRFDYGLMHDQTQLELGKPLRDQGVKAGSLLWLRCTMRPFASQTPQSGTLESLDFRHGDEETRALAVARRRLSTALMEAGVAKAAPKQSGLG